MLDFASEGQSGQTLLHDLDGGIQLRIYRLTPDGKKWPPAKKDGLFVLGDPAAKKSKHHEKNEVLVRSEEEAIRLLKNGFSIRIETDTRPSLIRRNLFIDGLRLT